MDLRWSPTIPLDFIWFQINGYLGWPHDHNVRRARIARYFAAATIKQHQDHCVQTYVTEPGLPERLAAADDDFNTLIAAGSVVRRSPFGGSPGVIREHWSREPSWSEQYLALFDEFEGREALLFASGREPFPLVEVTAAGAVLRIIRSIATHHPKRFRGGASVKKAAFLIEFAKGRYGPTKRNERDIRNDYEKYKSVAHLAAAFLVLAEPAVEFDMLEIEGICQFLAIAGDFQRFGTSFRPHARRTPLLDYSRTWSIPEDLYLPDPPQKLPVAPPLSEADLAAIDEKYGA